MWSVEVWQPAIQELLFGINSIAVCSSAALSTPVSHSLLNLKGKWPLTSPQPEPRMAKKKDSFDHGSGDRRNSEHEPDFGDPDAFVDDIPDEGENEEAKITLWEWELN